MSGIVVDQMGRAAGAPILQPVCDQTFRCPLSGGHLWKHSFIRKILVCELNTLAFCPVSPGSRERERDIITHPIMILHLFDSFPLGWTSWEISLQIPSTSVSLSLSAYISFLYLILCAKLLKVPLELKGLPHLQGMAGGGVQIIKKAKYISKVKPGKPSSFESISTWSLQWLGNIGAPNHYSEEEK